MPLWDKLRQELDRAGVAAQGAVDEARLRLEAFRAHQLADRAAQALGYAVHRRSTGAADVDEAQITSLTATLDRRVREADRLDAEVQAAARRTRGTPGPAAPGTPGAGTTSAAPGADPRETETQGFV